MSARNAHKPINIFCPFQKHSQWMTLQIYFQKVNVFERGDAAWPFQGEPSSDNAVPTAATHNAREPNQQATWYPQ